MSPKKQKLSVPKPMKKLTITIDYTDEPDGSHVGIAVKGKRMKEIFEEGEQSWTNFKGAIYTLIGEMGPIGPGRDVVVRSVP